MEMKHNLFSRESIHANTLRLLQHLVHLNKCMRQTENVHNVCCEIVAGQCKSDFEYC